MSLSKHQRTFTRNIGKLITYAYELGIELTFGDAYRSQSQMFLNYYGKKITNNFGELHIEDAQKVSWTLKSNHAKRLAVDFNFFIDGKYTNKGEQITILGTYWESLHPKNRAGMFWKTEDTPHFEMNV